MALIAHYKLDDNGLDSSGNGYDGVETNMSYSAGLMNNAGAFESNIPYIQIEDQPALRLNGSFSISAWIYPHSLGAVTAYGRIVDKSTTTAGTNGYIFSMETSRMLGLEIDGGVAVLSSANALTFNTWQHVVCTYDGARAKVYVNNIKVGDYACVRTPPNVAGVVRIGQYCGALTRGFDGLIDDIRIYNTALNTAEINTLYLFNSLVKVGTTYHPLVSKKININGEWKVVAGMQIKAVDTWNVVN